MWKAAILPRSGSVPRPGTRFRGRSGRGCRDGPISRRLDRRSRGSCARRRAAASTTVRPGVKRCPTARRPRTQVSPPLMPSRPTRITAATKSTPSRCAPSGDGPARPSLVSIRNWCASMHQRDAGRSPERLPTRTAAGATPARRLWPARSLEPAVHAAMQGRYSPATASARCGACRSTRRFRTRSRSGDDATPPSGGIHRAAAHPTTAGASSAAGSQPVSSARPEAASTASPARASAQAVRRQECSAAGKLAVMRTLRLDAKQKPAEAGFWRITARMDSNHWMPESGSQVPYRLATGLYSRL